MRRLSYFFISHLPRVLKFKLPQFLWNKAVPKPPQIFITCSWTPCVLAIYENCTIALLTAAVPCGMTCCSLATILWPLGCSHRSNLFESSIQPALASSMGARHTFLSVTIFHPQTSAPRSAAVISPGTSSTPPSSSSSDPGCDRGRWVGWLHSELVSAGSARGVGFTCRQIKDVISTAPCQARVRFTA